MLSNTKWEILQVFSGVNKVSVGQCEILSNSLGGDFAGIPWGKQVSLVSVAGSN